MGNHQNTILSTGDYRIVSHNLHQQHISYGDELRDEHAFAKERWPDRFGKPCGNNKHITWSYSVATASIATGKWLGDFDVDICLLCDEWEFVWESPQQFPSEPFRTWGLFPIYEESLEESFPVDVAV